MGWETSWSVLAALAGITAATGCARTPSPTPGPTPAAIAVQAGFLEVPPRTVTVEGQPVSIDATGLLFYNLRPADEDPADKPVIVLFNGFADDIVRAYGTGPMTVVRRRRRGAEPVVLHPLREPPLRRAAAGGLLLRRRLTGRAPGAADCAPDHLQRVRRRRRRAPRRPRIPRRRTGASRSRSYWLGESYARRARDVDPRLPARSLGSGAVRGPAPRSADRGGRPPRVALRRADPPRVLARRRRATRRPSRPSAATRSRSPRSRRASDAGVRRTRTLAPARRANARSLYNFTYTQRPRPSARSRPTSRTSRPTAPRRSSALPLTSIPLLAAARARQGVQVLASGRHRPLRGAHRGGARRAPRRDSRTSSRTRRSSPGKETEPTTPDWSTHDYEAIAFADNLHDVPAFLTQGRPRPRRPDARPRARAPRRPRRREGRCTSPSRLGDPVPRRRAVRGRLRLSGGGSHGLDGSSRRSSRATSRRGSRP